MSSAWCALDRRDLADARRRLVTLLREEPERREDPDGLGRSAMHAMAALGEKWVALNDFARTTSVNPTTGFVPIPR